MSPNSVMPVFDENDLLTRAESRVGSVLRGKFTIDGVLGVGGMAAVFAVTHQNSQRFALKLLHPELAMQESIRKRFVREGSAANSVSHDGVVRVFDNDEDESGAPFLLMELLEGASVKSLWVPPARRLPLRETLGIAVQLLDVLAAAHAQEIVHRDIKPSNLFVTKDGVVKVLDFGIAQLRQSAYELTRTGTTLGTPSFMAPEQALAKPGEIDARTDIWAAGATLFTMLSGEFVHEGDNAEHLRVVAATEPARSLVTVAPDIPSQVVRIVDRALAFDKASRFESAAVMRDAVAEILGEFYGRFSNDNLASFVKKVREARDTAESDEPVSSPPKRTEIDTSRGGTPAPRNAGSTARQLSGARSGEEQGTRRGPRAGALLALFGVLLGAGILIWLMNRPAPGKVTVLVTTDMLVPMDFDWLGWKVEGGEGKRILKRGEVSLADWKQLPVELTEISSSDAAAMLRLEIEARRGGEEGRLILESELQFRMPRESEKRLEIPLDLLCTKEASPARCRAGEQCRAGECVDIELSEAPPATSREAPLPACFDAAECLASGLQIAIPLEEPDIGPCVLKNSPVIFNGEQQNIGLVVNTSVVGNYGVCRPSGQCIIPLDHGGASGWQVAEKDGKTVGVRLPQAVCRGISLNRLSGVAIAPATPGCPAKSPRTPLCPARDACAAKEGICPPDFPPAWIGYECSGVATPQAARPDLLSCFLPPKGDEMATRDAKPGGRWCCSRGAPPSDDPLLIDDMSGGPQTRHNPKGDRVGGFWMTASDAREGAFSPPLAPGLFAYRTISPPVEIGGGRTFDRAACFKSSGFTGWYAMMEFGFAFERGSPSTSAADISQYTGMRFWAYSPDGDQKVEFRISDQNTFTEDPRSTCNQNPKAGKCGGDFGIESLLLTPEWKEYVIKWDDFTQPSTDWGQARFPSFDRTRVFFAYFSVHGRGYELKTPPFDFCVSQLYFTI
jgi:serine/threonine protein kinase